MNSDITPTQESLPATNKVTFPDIDKLERLAAKATKGQWIPYIGSTTFVVYDENKRPVVNWNGFDSSGRKLPEQAYNAEYIAAANPVAIQELINRVRAAEAKPAALPPAAMEYITSWASETCGLGEREAGIASACKHILVLINETN